SICDGQIMLDAAAFNEGRRPALDPGLSVSRVGGSAQTKAMKQVAGRLRIDLAQYGEMARFVKFGAEVDESTQLQLTRGERARELLKQVHHAPMALEQEILVLYAVVNGYFDDIAVNKIGDIEAELLEYATRRRPDVLQALAVAQGVTDEIAALLSSALAEFISKRGASADESVPSLEAVV
ncbi:MAG: F0F1 ATP synthase subunit alpha, partial [Coriobacteriia bacterium]